MKRMLAFAIATTGGIASVFAQVPSLQQQAPNMPAPKDMPAEKIEPKEPSATGSTETLSEKLGRSDGVIRPPQTGAGDDAKFSFRGEDKPIVVPDSPPVEAAAGSPGSAAE